MSLGYTKPLFILAFDQRSSFTKKLMGITGEPTPEQVRQIADFKNIIYRGFKQGMEMGLPKDHGAVLCDEQFGDEVLKSAKAEGCTFLLATEKSGQDELDFEYGTDFGKHIQKYAPTFVKVLIRYNPAGDADLNNRQNAKLKILSDYAHQNGYKFLIEPLIPATPAQLDEVGGDASRYDLEIRPRLCVEMIRQIQVGGADPDVWKIEGLEKSEQYQAVITQARSGGREEVGIVVLGRHAPDRQIEKWLAAAVKVPGVLGFAIGRTIFFDPLVAVSSGQMTPDQAALEMAKKYFKFYKFFIVAQAS